MTFIICPIKLYISCPRNCRKLLLIINQVCPLKNTSSANKLIRFHLSLKCFLYLVPKNEKYNLEVLNLLPNQIAYGAADLVKTKIFSPLFGFFPPSLAAFELELELEGLKIKEVILLSLKQYSL